jgi:phosphoribosylanthranilate isomerase
MSLLPGARVFARARRLGPALPFVKVCGLTREADVDLAVACGASAIGFVFWARSPRALDVATAARLRERVPSDVVAVGVFVDEAPEAIATMVRRVGLDAAQLHGDEPADVRDVLGVPIIKAVVGGHHDDAWLAACGDDVLLLVDARDEARRGGTGRVADWDAAHRLARSRALVLAGGLTAGNVAEAVRRVGPVALDVSSGVESAPGLKDAGRMRAFFAAVAAMEADRS